MLGGLADPVLDSQQIFRSILDVMAHPGRVLTLPPPLELPTPLGAGAAAICLSLLDFETPLWLDREAATPEAIEYLRFHCGVPIVEAPEAAAFALIVDLDTMPQLGIFPSGSDEYPDRSATVIVQVRTLVPGTGRRITGPGIDGEARIQLEGVPQRFWTMLVKNNALFPRGVDLILAAGPRVAALPRTTRPEI